MNEISNRFCLLEPDTIREALLLGHAIAPDITAHQFSATSPVLFDQSSSETDDGVIWNQTFRAVTPDAAVLQHKGAKLYPAFFMSDGSLRVIGTHDSVPSISVSPSNGGRYLVQVTFQAAEALTL